MDHPSLSKAVEGCEQLYHLAALFKIWTKDPNLHYKINVDGARAMLTAAKDADVQKNRFYQQRGRDWCRQRWRLGQRGNTI